MRVYRKVRYLIYNEDETLIFEGTAEECAKRFGVKETSFRSMVSKGMRINRKYEAVKDRSIEIGYVEVREPQKLTQLKNFGE